MLPVLLFRGHVTTELNNVTVNNDTNSRILIRSIKKNSIFLRGHCHFYHKRGAIIITSGTKLIFSTAKGVFFNNSRVVQKIEDPGSVMAVDSSTIILITAMFNYGQNCGGISATKQHYLSTIPKLIWLATVENCREEQCPSTQDQYCQKRAQHSIQILKFSQNKAYIKGGAIFIDDSS